MKAKRASLSRAERAAMAERQGFSCFTWGCDGGPVIAEHWTPVALGNDQKPDCLLCRACAAKKTLRDIKAIAKVKRLRRGKRPSKHPMKSRNDLKKHPTLKKQLGTGKVVTRG